VRLGAFPGASTRDTVLLVPMPSPSYTQDLLDKLRALPDDKLAEVVDFVEFLGERHARTGSTRDERLRIAAATGLLALPASGTTRSTTAHAPPVAVPGKLASEIVIEDRR
jgi:hypothetical protein